MSHCDTVPQVISHRPLTRSKVNCCVISSVSICGAQLLMLQPRQTLTGELRVLSVSNMLRNSVLPSCCPSTVHGTHDRAERYALQTPTHELTSCRQRVAINAVRLAAAVLRQARRVFDSTACQLLTHLMKPLAFQILAKVRTYPGSRLLRRGIERLTCNPELRTASRFILLRRTITPEAHEQFMMACPCCGRLTGRRA